MDLLVSSSVSEAQPFVLLEAMASGVPVVATSVGDCPSMLGCGNMDAAGICVASGDAEKMSAAIAQIIGNKELYRSLASNGIRHVEQNHNPDEMIGAYRQLYESLTAGSVSVSAMRKKVHE